VRRRRDSPPVHARVGSAPRPATGRVQVLVDFEHHVARHLVQREEGRKGHLIYTHQKEKNDKQREQFIQSEGVGWTLIHFILTKFK
jgi:hypothetical protein